MDKSALLLRLGTSHPDDLWDSITSVAVGPRPAQEPALIGTSPATALHDLDVDGFDRDARHDR